jgi:hypothetical protein
MTIFQTTGSGGGGGAAQPQILVYEPEGLGGDNVFVFNEWADLMTAVSALGNAWLRIVFDLRQTEAGSTFIPAGAYDFGGKGEFYGRLQDNGDVPAIICNLAFFTGVARIEDLEVSCQDTSDQGTFWYENPGSLIVGPRAQIGGFNSSKAPIIIGVDGSLDLTLYGRLYANVQGDPSGAIAIDSTGAGGSGGLTIEAYEGAVIDADAITVNLGPGGNPPQIDVNIHSLDTDCASPQSALNAVNYSTTVEQELMTYGALSIPAAQGVYSLLANGGEVAAGLFATGNRGYATLSAAKTYVLVTRIVWSARVMTVAPSNVLLDHDDDTMTWVASIVDVALGGTGSPYVESIAITNGGYSMPTSGMLEASVIQGAVNAVINQPMLRVYGV